MMSQQQKLKYSILRSICQHIFGFQHRGSLVSVQLKTFAVEISQVVLYTFLQFYCSETPRYVPKTRLLPTMLLVSAPKRLT